MERRRTVSIPLEQGNVFRHKFSTQWNEEEQSQSLWNRAMSFDTNSQHNGTQKNSLNPFGTGQCLSTGVEIEICGNWICLNPFGTGQCLSTLSHSCRFARVRSLNPFGTGQCLSTSVVE